MAKYHINPKTGNPNICRAETSCPFGDLQADHYPTKKAALAAYEKSHEGSFKTRPVQAGALVHGDKLTSAEDYANAPIGTVVQFSNGLRFVKGGDGNWETSQSGGLIFDNKEISEYPAENLLDKFSKVQTEAGEQTPTNSAGVRASLLKNSSYEEGLQARKYFILFNHRNPEQLKAASGKVKDQELVDDLIAANAAAKEVALAQAAVDKGEANVENSQTDAQRAGYEKVLKTKRDKLESAKAAAASVEDKIGKHMKGYAKQLVVHRRSLDSLERLANNGVKSRPPGIDSRIAKLESFVKETRSISTVAEKVNRGGAAGILAGAREYGNPIHVKSATELLNAEQELRVHNEDVARLHQAYGSIQSRTTKDAIQKELEVAQAKQDEAKINFTAAQNKVQLFLDDVRDRSDQERDVARELRALKIISR